MQLTHKMSFDQRKVEAILKTENKFISDLFSILSLPSHNTGSEDESEQAETSHKKPFKKSEKTRAKSLSELQDRLHAITSKKKLTYKDKLAKKSLKNRMKKKTKQDERNAQQKLLRAQKFVKPEGDSVKPAKPVFNSEGKMVFSKFDFSNLGTKKEKKQEKDPKKLLQKLEKQKEKIEELQETGDIEKVVEIKEKEAWKNALAKAQGEKVKDDPILLKKTVQRQEQKKRSSKKKWEKRMENVEKGKKERQEKRSENIEKRKQEKKKKKMKKAVKKGKIIPGF
ncbi:surfeit locus protein 6 homolog isoform X2 [Tribolium castaneum]|uniref:surfeit locus protein 6 homolog isoform X2 n=1 Tax=Tribolium castaneum TaxID=7070 RepID=UPI00046C1F3D|nr:PREDICTED: surfeit locus protein 6 homolog isoform X2 [Tribolium castaneum]|eukprot:XP_970642.2 PREDICTED: surfeit locus protein 6 homolog isoform X2 [Tribolium castaneum]